MALNLHHLDAGTRPFMVEEIDRDVAAGTLYLSPWLSARGRADWPGLLRQAALDGNDVQCARQLRQQGRISEMAERRNPKGGTTMYRVPNIAADTIAEGEFNRMYIRGLCCRALAEGIPSLIVYRAKNVENPRPESQGRIGSAVDPQAVLDDIRANPGNETWLGIPSGPNSGISLRMP